MMRLLIEVVLLSLVVALAWEKSISERVGEVIPALATKQRASAAPRRAQPVASNTSGAWMWDRNRRTALDRPAYNKTGPSNGETVLVDEYGRKYRLDAEGRRTYED